MKLSIVVSLSLYTLTIAHPLVKLPVPIARDVLNTTSTVADDTSEEGTSTSSGASPTATTAGPTSTGYPKYSTVIDQGSNNVDYGSIDPVTGIIDTLNSACGDWACDISSLVFESRYASLGGDATKLTFDVQGSWVATADGSNPKQWLVQALGTIIGGSTTTKEVRIGSSAHGSSGSVNENTAPNSASVVVSVVNQEGFAPSSAGSLSITMNSPPSSATSTCSTIAGALGAALGPIGAIASAFFGVVAPAVCQAA